MRPTHLIAATALVMLASCGSGGGSDTVDGESESPAAASTPARGSGEMPVPTEAESTAMVDQLSTIDPTLVGDPDTAMDFARSTCSAILGGVSPKTMLEGTQKRWYTAQGEPLSEDQANQVVEAVRDAAWCK